MMQIIVSSNFNLSANEVWHLVAERFGETGVWAARLDNSYLRGDIGVGAARVCAVDNDIVEEEIVAYHPEDMTFTYTLLDPPAAVTGVTNTWAVTRTAASTSQLSMTLDLGLAWWARPMSPLMRVWMKRVLQSAQEELVYWAETGEPHPRKQARNDKVAAQ